VLLESDASPLVPRLVDTADAGHGDPLYEFVPVLASCFACQAEWGGACWRAYRALLGERRAGTWPLRGEHVRLSYAATCYSLVHEEAEVLLTRVWPALGLNEEGLPAAGAGGEGRSGPSVAQLEAAMWGFLEGED
jgi:hypothetical protein